ncbi:CYTH domain-containing protein [Texcoconibacillus texcoconensis]|uniref:Uncharacterized protein YjbK n=1 Tax=Texcoconibacillus texcoconensis TaxID=1095777 RepID=A0A840QU25_9BACI|nr:CYTH domain-containing protein [Texcoconibacillus texcoconensis]MBB5174850.1 uncharacterized protein YjbK [Texcoconibacillus texcoconensis]
MTQEIEIEVKNLLEKTEYEQLRESFFSNQETPVKQTNYYFDTETFQLKEKSSALRVRQKNGDYVLTLKQPNEVGLLETHDKISKDQFEELLTNGAMPLGSVHKQIEQLIDGFKGKISPLGSLTTERLEKKQPEGLIVLDKSDYLDTTDYEVEFEADEEEKAQKFITTLLEEYNIPKRKTPNKIERFYLRKQALQ